MAEDTAEATIMDPTVGVGDMVRVEDMEAEVVVTTIMDDHDILECKDTVHNLGIVHNLDIAVRRWVGLDIKAEVCQVVECQAVE